MRESEQILSLVQDYIEQGIFPGAEFAVMENGAVTEYCMGDAAILPERVPLTAGKYWDLASVTKVVGTGTAVIDLVLSGQLELDVPLKRYYPDFADKTVTLRQLLTHTSGIDPFIVNRDQLSAAELKAAIDQIMVTADKTFRYTDINFILLGFMLEYFYVHQRLDQIFRAQIFDKWKMTETTYGPVENAVPTSLDVLVGTVHDPKARVLSVDCGSAGLFSTLSALTRFVQGYFADEKYLQLCKNYADGAKKRSLAWDLPVAENTDWLLHTGYTGTFILMNLRSQKAVIFLSNRVHLKDERAQWIKDRDVLIDLFIEKLS